MDAALQERMRMVREIQGKYFTELEEAVKRGAALLDQKMPGWASRVDVSRLDMRSSKDNLLMQAKVPASIVAKQDEI